MASEVCIDKSMCKTGLMDLPDWPDQQNASQEKENMKERMGNYCNCVLNVLLLVLKDSLSTCTTSVSCWITYNILDGSH